MSSDLDRGGLRTQRDPTYTALNKPGGKLLYQFLALRTPEIFDSQLPRTYAWEIFISAALAHVREAFTFTS